MLFIKRLNLKYEYRDTDYPIEESEIKILGITVFKSKTYQLDECIDGKYNTVKF